MPGGGAEIFDEEIRGQICEHKADGQSWLDIHRCAHQLGLRTNATMLYGHLEESRHRVDHLCRLRELQDETGGFQTFIPLAFHPENTGLEHLHLPGGLTDLRVMALSRVMLDNFDHIKAYWIMLGEETAQVALSFGADDLDGTVVHELIYHDAGAVTPEGLTVERLHRLILDSWAFRQSSSRTLELDRIDPDNLLLARMSIRRLESEALRDAILAISGSMNSGMFGQPVSVMEDAVGQIVLGKENLDGERKPTKTIDLEGEQFRRSLYVQVRRTRPLGVLETFDVPVMTPNCSKRPSSNVAPQSLMLMNSDFVIEYSERLARRVVTETGPDRRSQVLRAWRLAYGVDPDPEVIGDLLSFVERQSEAFGKVATKNDKATPPQRALASLCQALLSANRFLYVD